MGQPRVIAVDKHGKNIVMGATVLNTRTGDRFHACGSYQDNCPAPRHVALAGDLEVVPDVPKRESVSKEDRDTIVWGM